jgi:hypothetical protein
MLVNNAVKALHKKRKHQMTQNLSVNTSKASMLKYQALWYSSFIALYIWFSYWVAYDFFVWHKPIAEVNLANYVGAIVSIVFMWAGTKILKRNRIKAASPQQKLLATTTTTIDTATDTKNSPRRRSCKFRMRSPSWVFAPAPKVTGNTCRMSDMRTRNPMFFFPK